jgi:hypothetical protein
MSLWYVPAVFVGFLQKQLGNDSPEGGEAFHVQPKGCRPVKKELAGSGEFLVSVVKHQEKGYPWKGLKMDTGVPPLKILPGAAAQSGCGLFQLLHAAFKSAGKVPFHICLEIGHEKGRVPEIPIGDPFAGFPAPASLKGIMAQDNADGDGRIAPVRKNNAPGMYSVVTAEASQFKPLFSHFPAQTRGRFGQVHHRQFFLQTLKDLGIIATHDLILYNERIK